MKDIWKQQLERDQEFDSSTQMIVNSWIEDLDNVSQMKIPRCIETLHDNVKKTAQIHIFTDASEKAFAAVAYSLRINE